METNSAGHRRFLYICGMSAVGKKTLIERLLGDVTLQARFGICGGDICAFGADFGSFGRRHELAKFVIQKWQVKDDMNLLALKERFPDVEHALVVLWRPWNQWFADFRHKHPHDNHDWANIAQWWNHALHQKFMVDYPSHGFEVEVVDGSTETYDSIAWPSAPLILD